MLEIIRKSGSEKVNNWNISNDPVQRIHDETCSGIPRMILTCRDIAEVQHIINTFYIVTS